jgi:cholesterol transport system auxiliary component
MSQRISLLLLLALVSACSGLPKPSAQAALYDFGMIANTTTNNPDTIPVKLGHVEASPGLDGHEMRYRLAYQDPARVYAYNESRWVILPADLIAQRVQNRWVPSSDARCSLNITLNIFDQVFDSPGSSRGVVQLRAEIVNGNGHNSPRESTVITVENPSTSADAKGGVTALMTATDEAITKLATWVNEQRCASTSGEN